MAAECYRIHTGNKYVNGPGDVHHCTDIKAARHEGLLRTSHQHPSESRAGQREKKEQSYSLLPELQIHSSLSNCRETGSDKQEAER